MERIHFSPTVVLQLWTTTLPPNIQDMLTMGCDEQTGEAQARVPDRQYACLHMGLRDDRYETSPSQNYRSRGLGDTKAIRVRPPSLRNVYATACTIQPRAGSSPRARDDLHPNVTIEFGKRLCPTVDLVTVTGAIKSSARLLTRDRRTGDAYLIDLSFANRHFIPELCSQVHPN